MSPFACSTNGGLLMSSPHPSAVEELLTQWLSRHPGSPVRDVVDRAIDLGFAVVAPDGAAKYLRLVLDTPGARPVTLYVDASGLTAAGAAVKELAASLPGAVVRSRDVRLPFDSADPYTVLETFGLPVITQPEPVRQATVPVSPWAVGPVPEPAPGRRGRILLTVVAAFVLLFVVA